MASISASKGQGQPELYPDPSTDTAKKFADRMIADTTVTSITVWSTGETLAELRTKANALGIKWQATEFDSRWSVKGVQLKPQIKFSRVAKLRF